MAVGSVINATDYNNIRTLIDSIIGTGSSGYGRTLVSAAKSPTDLIQSTDVINLFLDCQSGFNHQNQAISNSVNVQTLDPGDTIFWSHFGDSGDVQGLYDIANSVNNFQTQVNNGSTDFASGSFTLQTSSATRTTAWNDTIEHTERYTWASDTARDYWFNAGGSVKFSGTLSGGQSGVAGSKDKDWQDLLSDIGTITFKKVGLNYVTSSSASVGSGSSWNEAQLEAGSERLLYQKYGGGCGLDIGITIENIKNNFFLFSKGVDAKNRKSFHNNKILKKKILRKTNYIFPKNIKDYQMFDRIKLKLPKIKNSTIILTRPDFSIKELNSRNFFITSGIQTWKKVSSQKKIAQCTFDGLGEDYRLPEIYYRNYKNIKKISYKNSMSFYKTKQINGYELIPQINSKTIKNLFEAKIFYWMSYSAFKLAKAIRPDILKYQHCSGPGSTFEQLKKDIPVKRLNLFFNYKDFKESVYQCR